jgi:pyridoxine 5-phosphate synthase
VCIVPERREELTTEGGIDAAGLGPRLAPIIERLREARIRVSLFVDPEPVQIEAAARLGANFVELHTGTYANLADADLATSNRNGERRGGKTRSESEVIAELGGAARAELERLRAAAKLARSLKLKPNAGHGLNYGNVAPISAIPGIVWLHIGHSIVARSLMIGMERAVREMDALINHKHAHRVAHRGGRGAR